MAILVLVLMAILVSGIMLVAVLIVWWMLHFRAFQYKIVTTGAIIVLTGHEQDLIDVNENLRMLWEEGSALEDEIIRCDWYWNSYHKPADIPKAIWYRFFARGAWAEKKKRRCEVWEEYHFVKKLLTEPEEDSFKAENV